MKCRNRHCSGVWILGLLVCVVMCHTGFAAEKKDRTGWEADSPYNRLYDPSEWDKLKGQVIRFTEITPFPGMTPGIAMIMKEREGETVTVHLGPKWYLEANPTGVRKGDSVTVKGVWVEINDTDVFVASKMTKGEYVEFKIRRTRDGKPYWTMTPEELARQVSDK